MLRGLYQATAAMAIAKAKQENISGNIANVETVGFKRQVLSEEVFSQAMLLAQVGPLANALGSSTARPAISEPRLDWGLGHVTASDSPFHLALGGGGFFAIMTADGLRYTRAGDFRLDAEGYLADAFGGRLLLNDGQPLRFTGGNFRVDTSGEVFQDDVSVGILQVVDFADRNALLKDRQGQFMATGLTPIAVIPEVKQFHLELSNVDLAKEIMEMLLVTRVFQSAQRIVATYDQLMERARDIGSAR